MRVLKPGRPVPPPEEPTVEGTCPRCGCVVRLETGEYYARSDGPYPLSVTYYRHDYPCPTTRCVGVIHCVEV